MDWNNDSQPTKEAAFAKLLPRTHNGAVVLLHSTSKTNAEILGELIDKWKAMGYRFGTPVSYTHLGGKDRPSEHRRGQAKGLRLRR